MKVTVVQPTAPKPFAFGELSIGDVFTFDTWTRARESRGPSLFVKVDAGRCVALCSGWGEGRVRDTAWTQGVFWFSIRAATIEEIVKK